MSDFKKILERLIEQRKEKWDNFNFESIEEKSHFPPSDNETKIYSEIVKKQSFVDSEIKVLVLGATKKIVEFAVDKEYAVDVVDFNSNRIQSIKETFKKNNAVKTFDKEWYQYFKETNKKYHIIIGDCILSNLPFDGWTDFLEEIKRHVYDHGLIIMKEIVLIQHDKPIDKLNEKIREFKKAIITVENLYTWCRFSLLVSEQETYNVKSFELDGAKVFQKMDKLNIDILNRYIKGIKNEIIHTVVKEATINKKITEALGQCYSVDNIEHEVFKTFIIDSSFPLFDYAQISNRYSQRKNYSFLKFLRHSIATPFLHLCLIDWEIGEHKELKKGKMKDAALLLKGNTENNKADLRAYLATLGIYYILQDDTTLSITDYMFKERDQICNLKISIRENIALVDVSLGEDLKIDIPKDLLKKIEKMEEIQNIFRILLGDFQKHINANIDDPESSELHFRKLTKDWIDDWYNKLTAGQKKQVKKRDGSLIEKINLIILDFLPEEKKKYYRLIFAIVKTMLFGYNTPYSCKFLQYLNYPVLLNQNQEIGFVGLMIFSDDEIKLEKWIENKIKEYIYSFSIWKWGRKVHEEVSKHALRAAISAIMSRNGSHNIGSHVINRVVENIDTLNIQDHKYFMRYLQQRMDFVAQISTDFPRWSTSHWFVMELMKNFYSQKHLLNYIAESEGLKAYEQNGDKDTKEEKLQCIIKSIKKYNCKSSKEPPSYDESYCEFRDPEIIDCKYKDGAQVLVCDLDICKADPNGDIKIAVPGGMVGFHALYTIIENFLRNSAKHNYARYPADEKENRKEPMLITFKIWNYEDVHDYYTVRIRDNYSYISGLIAESTFEEESAENLNEKKTLILHPVAEVVENIKLCLEEKENIRFDLANHENVADNNYDIIFIIDDGKVFREKGIKPSYCDLMLDSRVRFIEEAYWNDFLRKTKPTPISVDDQIRFLKQYFIPAHLKINNKIINPLIEDDGSLRKSDWGIAEMKISAGFLYKKDISQIGGSGEKNLDNLIKAIAIPEYRDGKIRAYRLGYEFRMLKPVDVLLIGHSGDDNEALKREAILPVDKYDKTKYSAEMAIILDAGDKLLSLLKFSENNIDKIKTLIEYYPGRLFIVSDDGKVKDKISGSKFIEKRIILISSEEFNKIFKDSNYTAFKNELLKRWIYHIMKLKAKEELHIVVNPTESPSVKSKIDASSLLDAFLFLKSAITEQNGMRLIKEKKVYQEILNRMLSGNIRDRRELKGILERDYTIDCNAINSVNTDGIKDIVDKTKPFIKRIFDDYGIFQSESYTPSTLPEIFKEKSITGYDLSSKLNSATDYFNQIKIYFYRESVNLTEQHKIIYERHRGIEEIEGFVYQENLGGGAVHFHLFAYPKNWIEEFAANITENGLLKIAIMDERVAGSNILKNYHIDLEAAGVYFIKKFFGFELDYEWSDDRFISIDEDGSKFIKDKKDFDIDILIIHQGLLDKMDNMDKETIADRFRQLKEFIPFIYVTSGRGRPDTIPEGVKYVPFGIIESTLLQKPHSKLLLTKQLLGGISD